MVRFPLPAYSILQLVGAAVAVLAIQTAFAPPAEAIPIAFGSNVYEFVLVADPFTSDNNSWDTASAAAAASVHHGVHGHLATVGSQTENDFLLGLAPGDFAGFAGAWLGGRSPGGWLVGPEAGQGFIYTNWGGVEPNNAGYAYLNIGTLFAGIGHGQWADDSEIQGVPDASRDPVVGYFIEFEDAAAAIPEPAAWALMVLGFAGLAARRVRPSRTLAGG